MQPKRSKYDTNPLDENVADRASESWGRDTGPPRETPTQDMSGAATRDIGRTSNEAARNDPEAEAATRRIDDSYPSVFVSRNSRQQTYEPPRPAAPANIYQPPPVPPPQIYQRPPFPQAPGARKVSGINIPEKWANALPYFPFYIGLVMSVIELLLVPRNESRTRFHAAQGFALHIAILAISSAFSILRVITDSGVGSGLFRFAAFIFLIVSTIRVLKGHPHHISVLDDARNWVDQKIGPRKQPSDFSR
jgi:uncharacterized membrane protein